jgi:hypothetical protein
MRSLAFVCSLCALALTSSVSFAQRSAPARDHEQHVVFDDDLLAGDLSTSFGSPIFGKHLPPARTRLIRPRAHFVPELLRSVERL